ncbi:hypothetical protein TTHERM_00530400 (macronuclear) [Tetrahymena thermophila SB210]|uniref:Uncharacterized protein n=1 Tax=Tetrahymena thermophila (strain SB210) TaxID=312017 RepID=I7MCX1_TETTS|nr:hypothetical protein TTHERM_00530400 [Tetrahymena thermophila SB210]EAR85082.2 hypothetical protein TTHERM_00530400 [Tetrahymena thermophila SB210]|eukprot:XP_001032745.2 hypothetical protein TTHERM_00530400 [Tetrahymena thermophila SB210]
MRDCFPKKNQIQVKQDLITNASKICKYNAINSKRSHRSIQVIKTYGQVLSDSTKIKKLPRYCTFKQLYISNQNFKSKEEVLNTLTHYACTVIRPEFDRMFIDVQNSNIPIKKQYQQNVNNQLPSDQNSEKSQTEYNRNLVTSVSSNNTSTKNLFQKENLTIQIQKITHQKDKYIIQQNGYQLKQQDNIKNEYIESNDDYSHLNVDVADKNVLSNQKYLNLKQFPFLKNNEITDYDKEAVSICQRIYSVIQDIGSQFTESIRKHDYNYIQLKIRPESEKYFTASIINIFQSFTKKHRAPYKMNSKEQTKKQIPTLSPSNNSEPFNSPIEIQNLYLNNEANQQLNDKAANIDIQTDENSSSSNQNIKNKKTVKKQQMRQSKFHNLKKSFMHALILLFQQDILNCLEIPDNHGYFLQQVVNRMRMFSTKTRSDSGQYEYYSHTHYTALLLKLNEYSLPLITQNELDLQLHKAMYQEDLTQSTGTDFASIKCNYYKSLIFKIIEMSINIIENQNHLLSNIECEKKSVCRFDYILRVKSGIEKLSQGIQVTRF